MQIEVIERYVDQVLEVNGMVKGTEEQLRLLLSHLYTAVGMYQLLDKDQKLLVAKLQKQLRHFFYAKCDLKERKSKKDKEKILKAITAYRCKIIPQPDSFSARLYSQFFI